MKKEPQQNVKCQICGAVKARHEVMPAELVRPYLADHIRQKHADWLPDGFICFKDLNLFRSEYVLEMMRIEKGELTGLEEDVVQAMKENETLSQNIEKEYRERLSFGQRIADRVASFGGSWGFIISFAMVLAVWIAINSVALFWKPFDPFPYILLNLILSTLAAIQAPVIMMSQNRQETKDRLRSENDYRVNLKAELEIRLLNEKIDFLLTKQWQRLIEIQQIQIELMEELPGKTGK
jgi:uncharacterized membrane protein